jgi:hypothetical protein
MFDEAWPPGVVSTPAATTVQTLIIKVLRVKAGDLLEAGGFEETRQGVEESENRRKV